MITVRLKHTYQVPSRWEDFTPDHDKQFVALCSAMDDFEKGVFSFKQFQICAVFAHELGHGLNKDVPKLQLLNLLNMLLIPWLHRHGKWEGLFFMEVGMLTMYFDFYTVPLVTLGFPLLY